MISQRQVSLIIYKYLPGLFLDKGLFSYLQFQCQENLILQDNEVRFHIANLCSHCGNQCGSFSGNWESIYLKTQQFHSWNALSYYKSICSTMFIAALFVIVRTWKQPRCPSIEEWLKKVLNIYTLEFYSAVKNNDILNFACKWMEIENAE